MANRLTVSAVALLLASMPFAAIEACGSSPNSSGHGNGDGGGSDDATTDGAGDDGSSSAHDGASDGGDGSARGADGGACTPGCPATVTCGVYVDCTGATLTCGKPCGKGESCVASGNTQSCQAPSCTGKCGDIGLDPCGVPISCGGCTGGQVCIHNACVTPPPPTDAGGGTCGKVTCTPSAGVALCGTVTNGCGQAMACTCPKGQECSGGVCGPPPPECTGDGGAGSACGTVMNACGSGTVKCGGCTGATACKAGVCTACTAPTCGAATCGQVANGCGPAVSCGSCGAKETCDNGSCCTPSSCAAAIDAGLVTGCAPVDLNCGVQQSCAPCVKDGVCIGDSCCTPLSCEEAAEGGLVTGCGSVNLHCGIQKSCAPCGVGEVCQGDTCVTCTPKTCSDFGGMGCGHSDGCGGTVDCCTGNTTCTGGTLCCAPGEVAYQNSCCKPTCDESQPPGAQVSCGQVLYCNGGGTQ